MGKFSTYLSTKFPKFLLVLVFSELWERFSYYAMRSIMTIYMINEMTIDDGTSQRTYSLMSSIGYLLPIITGFLADRYFGFAMMMTVGAIIISIGHFTLIFAAFSDIFFYWGIGLIAIGTGFFKGTITSLLGACYDFYPHLDRVGGFTLFYAGINLGAFFAFAISGFLAEYISYHFAFSIAGFGMLIGLVIFAANKKVLSDKDIIRRPDVVSKKIGPFGWTWLLFIIGIILSAPTGLMFYYSDFMGRINLVAWVGGIVLILIIIIGYQIKDRRELKNYGILVVYYIFLMIFFVLELQIGSLFMIFIDRNVYKVIFGIEIPASFASTINPAVIMITGFIISTFYKHSVKWDLPRIGTALFSNSVCFLILYWGTLNADPTTYLTSLGYPALAIFTMASGEVLMSPVLQAATTVYSPKGKKGLMIGIYMAMLGFAGLFGFIISYVFDVPEDEQGQFDPAVSLQIYKDGFLSVSLWNLLCCGVFLLLCPVVVWLRRPTVEEKEIKKSQALKKTITANAS